MTRVPRLPTPPCAHCQSAPATRPRGLCPKCHADLAVRARYGRTVRGAEVVDTDFETMEEVDALVDQMRQTLPVWWAEDVERMRERDVAGGRVVRPLDEPRRRKRKRRPAARPQPQPRESS